MINTASLLFTLAEHSPQIYFAYNLANKNFIYINPAFESFFQVSASQASTAKLFAMVHPDDQDRLEQSFIDLQPDIFKNNIEFRMILPDGKEYHLQLNLLIQCEEGNQNILTGYIEDRTEVENSSIKLDEFANKKNTILNIISHDLAGPLGSIQNIAAILSRKTNLVEDQEIKRWVLLIEEISKKSVHTIQEFVKQEFVELPGGDQ